MSIPKKLAVVYLNLECLFFVCVCVQCSFPPWISTPPVHIFVTGHILLESEELAYNQDWITYLCVI